MCDVEHPPDLLFKGEIRWRFIQTARTRLGKDSVANTSPVIGKRPFRTQQVQSGCEVECGRNANEVRHYDWVCDLRRQVDLGSEIDRGREDDNPIKVVTSRVENDNAEDLENKDFCPRISSHHAAGLSRWRTRESKKGFVNGRNLSEGAALYYCAKVGRSGGSGVSAGNSTRNGSQRAGQCA